MLLNWQNSTGHYLLADRLHMQCAYSAIKPFIFFDYNVYVIFLKKTQTISPSTFSKWYYCCCFCHEENWITSVFL